MLSFKLGRAPRKFSSKIMHMSSILAARVAPTPPPSVNWTKGHTRFGMMLNDSIGDCTCAAVYHAMQIWTANIGVEVSETDVEPLRLYEAVGGYNQDDPSTDRGCAEQDVLSYWAKTGVPMDGGNDIEKLMAFFEVDPRNTNDVKTVINECGVCYIGFKVPKGIDETPGATWDVTDPDAEIEGGHAVILVGYDADTVTLVSWGALYKMTWAFFHKYTDEAYALIDSLWNVDGKTPLGLTQDQLESMMAGIKNG